MAATPQKKFTPYLPGGQAALAAEVFETDRCAICGACVGHCPYFHYHEGRVILRDRCTLDRGRCYDFCPMAGARGEFAGSLGRVKSVFVAQAVRTDIRKNAQYGGVVSALVWLALSQGLIKEAVLSSGHPERPPYGVRAKTRRDVLAASGSRYAATGTVAALNQALAEQDAHPLGLVGTPCQIKAAAAMRQARPGGVPFKPKRIKLLIGLFCTWALDYRRLSSYLRFMLFGERALGYDIPPPPGDVFKVRTGDGLKAFPLSEIRPMSLNACRFCDDMTSTRADVSVGAVEGLEGWNTVIVRTAAGERLIKLAKEKKVLRVDRLPPADLEHLKEAAGLKKERSVVNWSAEA
ncbi:MAG: Coenzyme F420 hydrogenase/dehydrogenase, beta subunit C-terminal domain [Thermodesulfobacteriota bacterium]|nr:Coenzyme F420 hydrogenase/dehydrogenase, beta subunit C-terminal domain [Thermodesulfobacteriota bacterium]